MRLEYYSKDCRRIRDRDGNIIAFADALSNGKWQLTGTDGKAISRANFASPGAVKRALIRRLAGGSSLAPEAKE
jgi:hypothetical protein